MHITVASNGRGKAALTRFGASTWIDKDMPRRFALTPILVSSVLLIAPVAFADFTGRVVGVTDGDTIKVLHNGRAEKIRLNEIDAPEKGQPFGAKAKQLASSIVFGKTVTIKDHGRDKYGRTLGDVVLTEGDTLNRELVRAGLAWWYCKYSRDENLRQLEAEARAARRGLWADPNPVPPWCFRKRTQGQVCQRCHG